MCRLVEVLINLIDSLGNSAVTTLLFQTIKTRTECIHCQGLLAFDFFDFSVLLFVVFDKFKNTKYNTAN